MYDTYNGTSTSTKYEIEVCEIANRRERDAAPYYCFRQPVQLFNQMNPIRDLTITE